MKPHETEFHDTTAGCLPTPSILVRPRHADRTAAAHMADQLLPRVAANVALAYRRTDPLTAEEFRTLRKRLEMTQAQLAAALGVDVSSISNYEGARGAYKIPRRVELACETLLAHAAARGQ
jgi:DNA-binding transcriptional regulator YiaG